MAEKILDTIKLLQEESECKICGSTFLRHGRQIYCSIPCQRRSFNILLPTNKICKYCSTEFNRKKWRRQDFCSEQCQKRYYWEKYVEDHPDKVAATKKNWYEKNKDLTIQRSRKRHIEKRNEIILHKKIYYNKNKEQILHNQKLKFEQNKEDILKRQHQYYLTNRERFRKRENQRREKLGLPLISEGFVSQTRLLIYVKSLFPNDTIWSPDRTTLNGLELDIYIPSLKLAFEYNGYQHYEYPNFWHKSKEEFDAQLKRDTEKKMRCDRLGITLIIIKYDELSMENVEKKVMLHQKF